MVSAGKKAAATRKRRAAGKKAATTRKRRAAGLKAATTRKRRLAGQKAPPLNGGGPQQRRRLLRARLARQVGPSIQLSVEA
jgi:hypothetical protein